MKTEIKKMKLFEPNWWNPLFWLVVVLAPVCGIIAGIVAGAFCGLLIGYERGLDMANGYVRKIIAKLP